MVLLMPVAGVLVDRAERRRFIAIVDFIQALTTVTLILTFWTNLVSIWVVLALIGLRGVCQAFHLPAEFAKLRWEASGCQKVDGGRSSSGSNLFCWL